VNGLQIEPQAKLPPPGPRLNLPEGMMIYCDMKKARKISVRGIVQGVGFRPFIYRLAREYGLTGIVSNNSTGVDIVIEGDAESIRSFVHSIPISPPPLARIDAIETSDSEPGEYPDFSIGSSRDGDERFTLISPDVSVCDDCLKELFDPGDRRYRYPFINCTNCGPRFTIIRDIPYDRRNTTMSVFTMCAECEREYNDPEDRRFHAQPNACPACGPMLSLYGSRREYLETGDPISEAVRLLRNDAIIAVKGLGGYHLACDALSDNAIRQLRERKQRIEKPFAIMIPDLSWLDTISDPSEEEKQLLRTKERPIVLIKRKPGSPIPASVAPLNNFLGIMLPYTPLHHVLMRDAGRPLVMTSGNMSDEPIAFTDEDAFERLGGIADYFLTHDRTIHIRCDDSVGYVLAAKPIILRRSRGYVPYPIPINFSSAGTVLAVGGHLKNTFCLVSNRYAFISHHIGDLENYETLGSFTEGIEYFKKLLTLTPDVLAYDMHPDYLSTRYALESDIPVKSAVQHHHAHIVSCMTENGIDGEVIGVAFDGTGYGTDGNIWGGEFLTATPGDFKRFAHFEYFPLPGSEAAIREPMRTAAALLYSVYGDEFENLDLDFVRSLRLNHSALLTLLPKMIRQEINTPLTSAAGRLFDGIAALCGIRESINYEAQAAIEFQMCADEKVWRIYTYDTVKQDSITLIRFDSLIREIVADLIKGKPASYISGAFHNTVASIIGAISESMREETGLNRVVLSGGVFQNELLLRRTIAELSGRNFQIFTHSLVPPNDGGLALGQAVVAMHRIRRMGLRD
jgi:hydrogenase maturation protein HypF